ncbi:flavin reductase [Cryobacterium melibiosiphilum]|uniref:Flavin reductase n=1 Tax=Cryobacterium melibiosiphilum TaxID=995039 RepID=A0A3A5MIS7_9MICO|nr:flavin reductase family protein [Cryobacterium melibiosiphilum]RJT88781.1 flavin reductase [Cryobacterium melibiosiphilum]
MTDKAKSRLADALPATAAPVPPLEADPNAPIDLAAFKHAFRRHAAGVAIITSLRGDGTPVGFTATSLASLSAVPPLATFNMARTASAWPAILDNGHVIIHMLGARNRDVAEIMSGPRERRFEGSHWHAGPYGIPVINDVTSWMVGRIIERISVHNNAVVVVQIEEGGMGADDEALLYHERSYRVPSAELPRETTPHE